MSTTPPSSWTGTVLQPLLRSTPAGFYVDIGTDAGDDGIAARLSALGWSGLSIASAARPRHTILPAIQIPLKALANRHGTGTIHLLQVATGSTLSELDLAHARPWLVLVLSGAPSTWIDALLGAGYRVLAQEAACWCFAADEHYGALTQSDEPASSVGAAGRLLDAARALGALRTVASERADTVLWQRGLIEEAQDLSRRMQAEITWVRSQLDEQQRIADERGGQILALTRETAWLRGCVADATGALDEARNARQLADQRVTGLIAEADIAAQTYAQAQAALAEQHERAMQALAQTRATPLRRLVFRVRRRLLAVLRPPASRPEPGIDPSPAVSAGTEPAPGPARIDAAPPLPGSTTGPSITVMAAPGRWLPDPVLQPEAASAPMPPQTTIEALQTSGFVPANIPAVDPIYRAGDLTGSTSDETLPAALVLMTAERPAPEPAASGQQHPSAARRPVHVVHQFHPDAAIGDAITNAMLTLRGKLRAQGYESEIFAERVPPGLRHDIRPVETLPRHDGFVLLAHHSTGYEGFGDILAHQARKLLVYHNITPADQLAGIPALQHNATLGRAQLAIWRDHAEAALALSEYSATELRRLDFASVRSANLLFDLDQLQARAATMPAARIPAVFTILFVGRVSAAKAQDDLIAAYAGFRDRYALPSRLVLVGGFDPEEHAYLDRLNDIILAHGLLEHVLLTGLIPDSERDAWYARADLYVSLSHHEGFGIPLVEAMAYGVPVLAWPAGAIPYTLGGTGAVLTARTPESVAGHMLALAKDPARRASIVAAQTASLPRFAWPQQALLLQEALALAGAQPRPSVATHAALAANMQLVVAGHVNKTYSLAAVNRAIAGTFDAARPGAVRLMPVETEPTSFIGEVPPEAHALIARLTAQPPAITGPEVVISQHYPVHVPAYRGDLTLAMVAWEESLLPPATVAVLNAGFDAVLALSSFVARVLVDSGISLPVVTIDGAPPLSAYAALPDRPARSSFTFLHVSSAFPRKGFDVLLAAWQRAFRKTDAVRLVVKSFPNIHNDAAVQIARILEADPDLAPIVLIDEDLSEAALVALFADADAMVLPTRGEGYNLPAAEAMASGLPLIVTGATGHMDFCSAETSRLVRSRPAPSGSHLATPHSLWREPDAADLADAMREAVTGADPARIAAARAAIAAATDPAIFTRRLADLSATLILAGPPVPVRIAWITTWDVRCGVASYARLLLDAMPQDGIACLAILCDDRTAADGDRVRPCWSLDPAIGTGALLTTVQNEDPDVVMIQHQPGLMSWPDFAHVVATLTADGRAVVVTLHNTAHLLQIPSSERAATIVALRQAARILVHTLADLDRLESLGLLPALLPHGAPSGIPPRPVRTLGPGSEPVIGCYGFFLPGKGIGALIEAVAALRAQWPGIRLRLVNADYGGSGSTAEIASCRATAEALGLSIEWHLDYLPDAASAALLAGCDLVVLPYAPSHESSSAAARSVLAAGVPVAVTPIALFDELGTAAARLPGDTPAALADGIAALLSDPGYRTELGTNAATFLEQRRAPDIALRLHGMQLGLAAQRRIGAAFNGATWLPRDVIPRQAEAAA